MSWLKRITNCFSSANKRRKDPDIQECALILQNNPEKFITKYLDPMIAPYQTQVNHKEKLVTFHSKILEAEDEQKPLPTQITVSLKEKDQNEEILDTTSKPLIIRPSKQSHIICQSGGEKKVCTTFRELGAYITTWANTTVQPYIDRATETRLEAKKS